MKTEKPWLKEPLGQSLQVVALYLTRAFSNYFEGRAGKPRFKSKRGRQSFHCPQNVGVADGKLLVPKFWSGIPVRLHRPLGGSIRNATVSRDPSGKYYVSITIETEKPADGAVLPFLSKQKRNDTPKVICERASVGELIRRVHWRGSERREMVTPKYNLIGTHCHHRSFVVNALYLGIPFEMIIKWTGDADYRTRKPYFAIVDDLKAWEIANGYPKAVPNLLPNFHGGL